jgi:hypothetical protein
MKNGLNLPTGSTAAYSFGLVLLEAIRRRKRRPLHITMGY